MFLVSLAPIDLGYWRLESILLMLECGKKFVSVCEHPSALVIYVIYFTYVYARKELKYPFHSLRHAFIIVPVNINLAQKYAEFPHRS